MLGIIQMSLVLCAAARAPDPQSYRRKSVRSALDQLLAQIDAEIRQLQREADAAESRGFPVYLERTSLELARYYRNVSEYDATATSMSRLLAHYSQFYADAPRGFADSQARSLPLREANDTLTVVRHARAALVAARSRPPLPSRETSTVCNGYFCNGAGQPVIPVGFNVWSFPKSAAPFSEKAAGINIATTGLGIDRLQENFTLDSGFVHHLYAELDAAVAKNITIHTLGFGSVPKWAENQWPGIISGNFTQHGVNFDISSPGVPVLMRCAAYVNNVLSLGRS